MSDTPSPTVVAALYRFVRLPDFASLRQPLLNVMQNVHVYGTLLLAQEGINGTIAGSQSGIDVVLDYLNSDSRLSPLEVKYSQCATPPFKRTRVRLKKEIVTLGVDGIDPNDTVGTYVEPEQWNELIADPDIVVIDTRNDYEVAIGSFARAINPHTDSFREFPQFVTENLDASVHTKVAMYCTGGIRCEKSTALLKKMGFQQVYHLRGGILKYLERIPQEQSTWSGECFVFDERVSVKHGLAVGDQVLCYGCGWPVSSSERQHPDYVAGVHCPRCVNLLTDGQKRRFAERQRQFDQRSQERHEKTELHDGAEQPIGLARNHTEFSAGH